MLISPRQPWHYAFCVMRGGDVVSKGHYGHYEGLKYMSEQSTQVEMEEKGDWLLRVWIASTSANGEGLEVVLTTAAGVISGMLISEVRFLDSLGSALADGWGERGEVFRNMFAKARDLDGHLPGNYVHLQGAQLVTPQGAISVGVNGLWRGNLDSIIGHSLGRFTLPQAS